MTPNIAISITSEENFFNSKNFLRPEPKVQSEVKSVYSKVSTSSISVKNLFELVGSKKFFRLEEPLKLNFLEVYAKRPNDVEFRKVVVSLAGKKDFKSFNYKTKLKVLSDLDKTANTPNYKKGLAKNSEKKDKTFLLEKIRKTSIFCGKSPANVVARNTLNKLTSGSVPMKLEPNNSKICGDYKGQTWFGCNIPGTRDIYINKSTTKTGFLDFIETICQETNHALNNNVKLSYVVDGFLSEYRAHIVGKRGRGETLNASLVLSTVDILGRDKNKTPNGYKYLADFYRNKKFPQFKKLIDKVYVEARKGKIIDASEMRKILIATKIFNTPYINGTFNVDNS